MFTLNSVWSGDIKVVVSICYTYQDMGVWGEQRTAPELHLECMSLMVARLSSQFFLKRVKGAILAHEQTSIVLRQIVVPAMCCCYVVIIKYSWEAIIMNGQLDRHSSVSIV